MTEAQLKMLKEMINELNFKIENGCSTNYIHGNQDMSTREVEIYLMGQRNALINVYLDFNKELDDCG